MEKTQAKQLAKKAARKYCEMGAWMTRRFGGTWLWETVDQAYSAWSVLHGRISLKAAQAYLGATTAKKAEYVMALEPIAELLFEAILLAPTDVEESNRCLRRARLYTQPSSTRVRFSDEQMAAIEKATNEVLAAASSKAYLRNFEKFAKN